MFKFAVTKYIPNQMVYTREYSKGEKWIEGTVDRPFEKKVFNVRTSNGYVKQVWGVTFLIFSERFYDWHPRNA